MSKPPATTFFQTAAFGTLCGLFAALSYTACNACLRSVREVDPFLVAGMRAWPTVLLLAPVVFARPLQGLPLLPPLRIVLLLIASGLMAHVAGNSLFQFGLSIVGMAIAVPLCLGSMIVTGAILGRTVLNEAITPRMAVGLLLLIAAIFVLAGGAHAGQKSVSATAGESVSASAGELALGIATACASGVFYAVMGATIRHATRGASTITQTLTIVSFAGMITLGAISSFTVSEAEWDRLTGNHFLMMSAAGLLNAIAFLALTRALQLTSLVYVQAVNATQAAMAAVAGIMIFNEAISPYLFAGVALTVIGLAFMQHGANVPMASDP